MYLLLFVILAISGWCFADRGDLGRASAKSAPQRPKGDPYCQNGLKVSAGNGNYVCCPSTCGTCGGIGCELDQAERRIAVPKAL